MFAKRIPFNVSLMVRLSYVHGGSGSNEEVIFVQLPATY